MSGGGGNRGSKGGTVEALPAVEIPISTAGPSTSSWEASDTTWIPPESTSLSQMSPGRLPAFASTEGGTLGRYQNSRLGSQVFDPYGLNAFSARLRPGVGNVGGAYSDLNKEIQASQERMSGARPESEASMIERRMIGLERQIAEEKRLRNEAQERWGRMFSSNRNRRNNGGLMSLGYFQGGLTPMIRPGFESVTEGAQAPNSQGLPNIGALPAGLDDILSQIQPSDVQAFEGTMKESQVSGDELTELSGRSSDELSQLIEEVKLAVLDQHPDPDRAAFVIDEFIEVFGQAAFEEFSVGVVKASDQEATMLAGAGPSTGIPTGAPGETIDSMTEIIQSVPQAPMMAARGGRVPDPPGDFSYEAWGSVPPMPMRSGGIVGYQEGGIAEERTFTDPGFSYEAWGGLEQAPQMPMRGGGRVPNIRYQRGGPIAGPGDGMSDSIPANISGQEEVRLSEGEYIVPADAVSGLGNGSTNAGADVLEEMVSRIRGARTGMLVQPQAVNPRTIIPR